MERTQLSALARLAFASALLLACEPPNDTPTTTSTTEAPCEGEGCYCTQNSVCDDGLVCVDWMCTLPPDPTSTTVGPTATSGPTTPSTTDDTSEYTTDYGCNFVGCIGDWGGGTNECDVFAQDCDVGEKCAAWDQDGNGAWDSTKCVEVMGNGQHGDPCMAEGGASGVDDCGVGVMCWNLNEEGVGTCIELCTGTPEDPMCAPPNTSCVIANDGVLNLCLPGCDPILQDCNDGDVCIGDPMGDGFVCVLDASGGMSPVGTPCEFANVCNPGLFCASPQFYTDPNCADSLGCCAPFCDLTDPNACMGLLDDMAECVAWYEEGMAPPEYVNVGGCGIPA